MSFSSASGPQQQQISSKPTPEQVRAAAQAIGSSLESQVYAIVGGAACSLLGSSRVTTDVDIVVPQGSTKETRQKLKSQAAHFEVKNRTLHTYYKSVPPVEVEILTPPSLFKENFTSSTPVVVIEGAKVLKPALILNANVTPSLAGLPKTRNVVTHWISSFASCGASKTMPFLLG